MAERHKWTDGPMDVGRHPASKLVGSELGIHTAEALCSLEWQTDRDGDGRRRCRSPRIPLEEETIPWEEPGQDG